VKIVLTGTISGTRNGVEWPRPGVPFDLPDDEAVSLINQGQARAVAVLPAENVEVAVVTDPSIEVRAPGAVTTAPPATPVPAPLGMTTKNAPAVGRRGRSSG
jgi:hypothetical protein